LRKLATGCFGKKRPVASIKATFTQGSQELDHGLQVASSTRIWRRFVLFLSAVLLASCVSTQTSAPMRLYVRQATYEVDGHSFLNSADLEAFLRDRKPAKIYVVLEREATYEQVRGALVAIQHVGGVDVDLVGDEAPN